MSRHHYLGIQLVELLVALGMISVLAMFSLPMLTQASDNARAAACQANLQAIGDHLQRELDRSGCFPTLAPDPSRLRLSPDPPPPPAVTLAQFVLHDNARLLLCPSDESANQPDHTSYRWFDAWNGIAPDTFRGLAELPLLVEKDSFHDPVNDRRNALLLYRQSPDQTRFITRWVDGQNLVIQP